MNDLGVMDVSDSFQDHSKQRDDDARFVQLFLLPEGHQVLAREIFSDEDIMGVFLVELLEGIDVLTLDEP